MIAKGITINARKFDGSLHRSWKADLLDSEGPLLTFLGRFEFDVSHPELGFIRRGTYSYEYYWLDRWYNVFRFHEPEGTFRNFYCNINKPPVFDGATLDYVDLDIDLLVVPGRTTRVLDREEFELNAEKYSYPGDVKNNAALALRELSSLIDRKHFPFDPESFKCRLD